ncbi:MAG: hypothetical protein ACYCZF_01745 [Anaerolineae bacterium]
MKLIASASTALEWKHMDGQRYELVADNNLYAVMNCESPYDLCATAMTIDDTWYLRCLRLLDSRYTVRTGQEREEIAFFTPVKSAVGVLQYINGKVFTLRTPSYNANLRDYQRTWSWQDENVMELVTFMPKANSWYNDFYREARVTITHAATSFTELPLLTVLGWYIILLHHDDEEAVLAQVLMTIATANMYS